MPRQEVLSPAQRAELLALPSDPLQIAACPLLTPADLESIDRHRGRRNRIGFAVQLYFLRHHGRAWASEETLPPALLRSLGDQIGVAPGVHRGIRSGTRPAGRPDFSDYPLDTGIRPASNTCCGK